MAFDCPEIDLEGKFVLPGLIDMHCHILESFAPHFVAAGVTTVRNTAGNVLQLKDLIEADPSAPTPRVYSADRMIDGPPGLWGPSSSGNFVAPSKLQARNEVKRQAAAGAKFIKVYGWLPKEEMEAVVEEAKAHNLEVSCDLLHSYNVNALDAAKIGVTWFEHASGFLQTLYPSWNTQADQEEWDKINWAEPNEREIKKLCEEMIKYNVKLCPTLVLSNQIMQYPDYWNPQNEIIESIAGIEHLNEQWGNMSGYMKEMKTQVGLIEAFTKKVTKTYFDLGGTVVTGTDTPAGIWTYPGAALHRELELFVEIGFSEMEALQAATIKAAEAIGLNDIGVIKNGAMADLVVLSENPLADIRNTKTIDMVIKGGKVYTQSEILENTPNQTDFMERYENFELEFAKIMEQEEIEG
ncbi:amidohydrolase family protein [Planococcus sp. N028]|uniref:Amidohydrolase family protein n=1 Tax=Planococcus shixiaomingii TaxID=3058393 RepID=A0ABT8MYN4_9BACL|nr:amidohydrolase family protein [Planococcus sp. N028]